MSANLLTLNSSKTEFLIIGLKQQLSKIDIIIIIFVYCRLTHATEQKFLPQQAEISGIIVA